MSVPALTRLDPTRFDHPEVLRAVAAAGRQLAELKGVAASLPNSGLLLSTLPLQEARESSAIENIVTTQDELFREAAVTSGSANPATKEVLRYGVALRRGFEWVKESGLLTTAHIKGIQAELERSDAGFRRLPGTHLRDGAGRIVYSPPQDANEIVRLMSELEQFINAEPPFDVDPLVRMAIIHHQFESIHPFYDGNGRTGRIINVLYLVKEGLLDLPVLYMSRYIVRTTDRYYALLQSTRDEDRWEQWVCYLLAAVEHTARDGIRMIAAIRALLARTKQQLRARHRFYSQDLLNSLFRHPYTRIGLLEEELGVSRITATRYLNALADDGLLQRERAGRGYLYINRELVALLAGPGELVRR